MGQIPFTHAAVWLGRRINKRTEAEKSKQASKAKQKQAKGEAAIRQLNEDNETAKRCAEGERREFILAQVVRRSFSVT